MSLTLLLPATVPVGSTVPKTERREVERMSLAEVRLADSSLAGLRRVAKSAIAKMP